MNSASIDPLSSFNLGHGPLAPDEDIMVHGRSPKELYTSPEHHAREVSEVFEKSWVNVGRVNEFPENGSFVVRELLGRSILIIRGRDAKLSGSATPAGHDLPLLGLDESPRFLPEWDALIVQGVQPALLLGAERRHRGPR